MSGLSPSGGEATLVRQVNCDATRATHLSAAGAALEGKCCRLLPDERRLGRDRARIGWLDAHSLESVRAVYESGDVPVVEVHLLPGDASREQVTVYLHGLSGLTSFARARVWGTKH